LPEDSSSEYSPSDDEVAPPRKTRKVSSSSGDKVFKASGRTSFRSFAVFPEYLKDPAVVLSLSANTNYPPAFREKVISAAETKFQEVFEGRREFGRSIVVKSIPKEAFKPPYQVNVFTKALFDPLESSATNAV
jgi:hypothetical protein